MDPELRKELDQLTRRIEQLEKSMAVITHAMELVIQPSNGGQSSPLTSKLDQLAASVEALRDAIATHERKLLSFITKMENWLKQASESGSVQ